MQEKNNWKEKYQFQNFKQKSRSLFLSIQTKKEKRGCFFMVGNTGVCNSFLLHICGSFKKLIRK